MAIQVAAKKSHVLKGTNGSQEFGVAALTGTYVTNGFAFNAGAITGTPGSSEASGMPLDLRFISPLGYVYVATFGTGSSYQIANVVIYSDANTQIANGATPEASVPYVLTRRIVTP